MNILQLVLKCKQPLKDMKWLELVWEDVIYK